MGDTFDNAVRGRNGWIRLPLFLWLVWLGVRLTIHPNAPTLFDAITLGIHEIGHVVLGFAGPLLGVAGGSLFQVLAPMAVIAVFVRQNDLFALTVGGVWWSTSLYGVATYLGDARSQSLPLVSLGGGDPIHDWNYLLTRMHLLEMDGFLSGVLRVLAFLLMWSSIAWGGYVLYAMLTRQGRPAPLSSRAS